MCFLRLVLALTLFLACALPLPCEEQLFGTVKINRIEFYQKGKASDTVNESAPVRIRAYLEAKGIRAELRNKFVISFFLDDTPLSSFPISDIRYTPFVDYVWENPVPGTHSVVASLSAPVGPTKVVSRDLVVEVVKPVLKVNRLEIDTTRILHVGDKVRISLFVGNISEKVILPDDFVARIRLEEKKKNKCVFLDFPALPRISPKVHNISLGSLEWTVEDGNWFVYPEVVPTIKEGRESLEVFVDKGVFLELRVGESRPDLVIGLSVSPQPPSAGEEVNVLVTIRNEGNVPCEKYNLSLYVDGKKKGSSVGEESIPAQQDKQFSFPWVAEPGSHYLKVLCSYEFEGREFPTRAECSVNVGIGVELKPRILSWRPDEVQHGNIVTVLAQIENTGPRPAPPWDEQAGKGYKAIFSVDGIDKEIKYLDPIPAGEKADFDFNWEAEEGKHLLKFSCWYQIKDMEPMVWSDERYIEVSPAPNLVCIGDTWTPAFPTEGDIVEVRLVVKNEGGGPALQWDGQKKQGYILVFSFGSLEERESMLIPAGGQANFSFRVRVEKHGEYPVKVSFVDPWGREIGKPYSGVFSVLPAEPIDEVEEKVIKLLLKFVRKKASLYRLLGASLKEMFSSASPEKARERVVQSALKVVKASIAERDDIALLGDSGRGDLAGIEKALRAVLEEKDGLGASRAELNKNLADYVSLVFLSEQSVASLLENEIPLWQQILYNRKATRKGASRPYPEAKNILLDLLRKEGKVLAAFYEDFQKRQKLNYQGKETAVRILSAITALWKVEVERAKRIEQELYRRGRTGPKGKSG